MTHHIFQTPFQYKLITVKKLEQYFYILSTVDQLYFHLNIDHLIKQYRYRNVSLRNQVLLYLKKRLIQASKGRDI